MPGALSTSVLKSRVNPQHSKNANPSQKPTLLSKIIYNSVSLVEHGAQTQKINKQVREKCEGATAVF
jgi:hypothetical protein